MAKIFVALDNVSPQKAVYCAKLFSGLADGYKFNDVLDEAGMRLIKKVFSYGEILIDQKFFDIPTTMINRMKRYVPYASYFTAHTSNGAEALKLLAQEAPPGSLLGVNVLSSFTAKDCEESYGVSVLAKVLDGSRKANDAGFGGLICFEEHVEILNRWYPDLKLFAVGTRSTGVPKDEHVYSGTPADAAKNGAYGIIVGREVLHAKEPLEALRSIRADIAKAQP